MTKSKVLDQFGSNVFNETIMIEKLPKETYLALKRTMDEGLPLEPSVAHVVANAMKDWAIEKGSTHYTHWFQPMTGITAEKHDAFISPSRDGSAIMEFSGKALIMGEPDASSFPSGGLRATFEARGYTAWDPTSFAFVKGDTLYIPTAFCSYSGEVLDKKTPLLRSMEVLSKECLRVLNLFNNPAKRVVVNVGPEQEYFLIDRDFFLKRKDILLTGRSLFGAAPPKGQEMDDHYFGNIKDRISLFMKELDEELWKLGIYSKTKHNEVAPAQHEFAPIFTTCNIAADQNQLSMEMLQRLAVRHNLACLLHEKPFAGVNGSGKHVNWSMGTNLGENLLDPGTTPAENKQFLFFLAAIVKAVDTYGDLLRLSVATAGNDHRLGANEAPPAIISMFIGDELGRIVDIITNGGKATSEVNALLETRAASLPDLPKDNSDRNRTSPFAFTGNKFEFRMPGSSQSISGTLFCLNTMVAETLSIFADELETAADFDKAVDELIINTLKEHKRIIFNGNNYADEWKEEAARRGLPNLPNTPVALKEFISDKNIDLLTKHGILTESEIHSRYEIVMDDYCKILRIEAKTMLDMARQEILPAVLDYSSEILANLKLKKESGLNLTSSQEEKLAATMSNLAETLILAIEDLDTAVNESDQIESFEAKAVFFHDTVMAKMSAKKKPPMSWNPSSGKAFGLSRPMQTFYSKSDPTFYQFFENRIGSLGDVYSTSPETVNKVLSAVFQQNRRPLMYVTVYVASCGFSAPCSKPFLGSLLFCENTRVFRQAGGCSIEHPSACRQSRQDGRLETRA